MKELVKSTYERTGHVNSKAQTSNSLRSVSFKLPALLLLAFEFSAWGWINAAGSARASHWLPLPSVHRTPPEALGQEEASGDGRAKAQALKLRANLI